MTEPNNKSNRNKLAQRLASFPDWHALETALAEAGYLPVLRRDRVRNRSLGATIEGLGRPVYWVPNRAGHAN
jgi:hypothetical protein